MKALIIGHVPPARTQKKNSWDETCWQKYALWMRQYRDVIVGGLYGHMNLDHFMLQDFDDINKDVQDGYEMVRSTNKRRSGVEDEPINAEASGNYLIDLRDSWSKLPKEPSKKDIAFWEQLQSVEDVSEDARPEWEIEALVDADLRHGKDEQTQQKKDKKKLADYFKDIGGEWGERFSISHAAPSVVPNYFPTIRVYEYNVTGLNITVTPAHDSFADRLDRWLQGVLEEESDQIESTLEDMQVELQLKKKKPKKRKFHVPEAPTKASPPGPAYSPQTLSLLGYVQYYANLTRINNDFVQSTESGELSDDVDRQKWNEGKHHGKKPHDKDQKPNPKKFKYEVLYDTRDGNEAYTLPDMSVRHYLNVAQQIGKFKPERNALHVGTDVESTEDVEDEESNEDMEIFEKGKKGKKGGHKKKKKKHHKNPRKANRPWYTFVERAFVGTKDLDEIEDQFGG